MTTEDRIYRQHLARCEAAARGSWCRQCRELCRAADAADWWKGRTA